MESKKVKHLMYVPFTGLGLYGGFRGNTWLKNRIKIFKQFVIPSLMAQTEQNFTLWISWRREERNNPIVREFIGWLDLNFNTVDGKKVIHTFAGVCFYDDKYPDEEARIRLVDSIHNSMPELLDVVNDYDQVFMTIQPSDDLYHYRAVEGIQQVLKEEKYDAIGFKNGYICNYNTKSVAEYNPQTNPPFYTIKFKKDIFIDPRAHADFTALKKDVGKYKKGTPLPSHEYVGDCVRFVIVDNLRGFLVGTHGANISTTFSNPYKGRPVNNEILKDYGIALVPPLEINIGLGKKIMLMLPYKVQRKLRYWINEKLKL